MPLDEYEKFLLNQVKKELKKTPNWVSSRAIDLLKQITWRLITGDITIDDEDAIKRFEKVALELIKKQQNRNKFVKHGGFWQEGYNTEEGVGGAEEFFYAVRIPTAQITSFLSTVYLLSPKPNEKIKEAINRGFRFNGIIYISYGCRPGIAEGWYSSGDERLRDLFRVLTEETLAPQYLATFYREDERLLPLLSFIVKTYLIYKNRYLVNRFIREGELPPEIAPLVKNRKLRKFIYELRKQAVPLNEDRWFALERLYEELTEQFKKAGFDPEKFKEPDFLKEEEKWLAED